MAGKQLALEWFSKLDESTFTYACKCGATRIKNKFGYSNLLSHIRSQHKTENNTALTTTSKSQVIFFIDSHDANGSFSFFLF